MSNHRYAIIMAGGSGERFWPLSRRNRPKQLVILPGQTESLLTQSLNRLNGLFDPEKVLIITSEHLKPAILESCPDFPADQILVEPAKRNTAGCLLWVAAILSSRHEDASEVSMAVVTADHLIETPEQFQRDVDAALTIAERQRMITTLGILPTRPETGYGYLEADLGAELVVDQVNRGFRVVRFYEKPSFDLAARYAQTPGFYWNSGMFFWTVETFRSELKHGAPKLFELLDGITEQLSKNDVEKAKALFLEVPDISIDYALMERSGNIAVIGSQFSWDDVGSWDAVSRFLPSDSRDNATYGDNVLTQTADCLVYNESSHITVAMTGVYDLLVVVTDDAVLICNKQKAQEVRSVVQALKEAGNSKL